MKSELFSKHKGFKVRGCFYFYEECGLSRNQPRKIGFRKFKTKMKRHPHPKKLKIQRVKSCPFCGHFRGSGYINCCKDCYWILEWRKWLTPLLEQIKPLTEKKGAGFGWKFVDSSVILVVRVPMKVKEFDVVEKTNKTVLENFCAEQMLSFYELRELPIMLVKKSIMDAVSECFKNAMTCASENVDENGNMLKLGGVPLPTKGNWHNLKKFGYGEG